MTLDFAEVAAGVRKNNMGLAEIRFESRVAVEGSTVRLVPTGQAFELVGPAPGEGAPAWRKLRVLNWETKPVRVAFLP